MNVKKQLTLHTYIINDHQRNGAVCLCTRKVGETFYLYKL